MEEVDIARAVLDGFDVGKLGEESAKEALFEIVNWTNFPNNETTQELVGRAEGLISELLGIEDEPHMDHIAVIENESKNRGEKMK